VSAPDKTEKKKAFFSSLHGVITAIAALTTASVAVLGLALNQGWLSGGSSRTSAGGTSATTAAAPQFAVDPPSIVFQPVGPTTASVQVSNTGVVPMTVEPASVTGPGAAHFTATTGTCDGSVEPGLSCQLQVMFSQTPGTFNADLVVEVTGAVRAAEVPIKATAIL
jgi:hypothetical protein